jgi:hypothetical protein
MKKHGINQLFLIKKYKENFYKNNFKWTKPNNEFQNKSSHKWVLLVTVPSGLTKPSSYTWALYHKFHNMQNQHHSSFYKWEIPL